MRRPRFILFIILVSTAVCADAPLLERYIDQALENNLALKQQEFSLQKSLAALKQARGMFFPSLGINARYSRAGGGRTFDIPVGSLVNPIHKTLNQLLQQPRFPTDIPDQTIPFLRREEQETKLQLVQPLIQPGIYYNYRIKKRMSQAEGAARDLFIRHLVADVKIAYFNYLKTRQIVELLNRTETVLRENLRISEKLFENQKATKEVVYRAQAELSELQQKQAEAEKNRNLAAAYLNFLLNRPLESAIGVVEPGQLPVLERPSLTGAVSRALENRMELVQLHHAEKAAENGVKLAKSGFWPDALLAVDYGFQGEDYRLTEDADFWMASVIVRWNLFNGFQDRAKVQQRRLEQTALQARLLEVKEQIRLQVREAVYNLEVAEKSIETAEKRRTSARKSFEIVDRKYREGMALQIEFLNARTALTEAEISHIIALYDYHIRSAEMERVTGSYSVQTR